MMEKVEDVPAVAEVIDGPGPLGEYLEGCLDDENPQGDPVPQSGPAFEAVHHLGDGLQPQDYGVGQYQGDDEVFESVRIGQPVGEVAQRVNHGRESATSHLGRNRRHRPFRVVQSSAAAALRPHLR